MDRRDTRWLQRFDNYKRALFQLENITKTSDRAAPELEDALKLGLIKAFEIVFELAWNLMKDFLTAEGIAGIIGSRSAIREAFNKGLLQNGQIWMDMIDDRNASTHTYDEAAADMIASHCKDIYISEFIHFRATMENFAGAAWERDAGKRIRS